MGRKAIKRWLNARAIIAIELHKDGKIHYSECMKAEADAAFESYSSPIRLRDGTVLPDSEVFEERYNQDD